MVVSCRPKVVLANIESALAQSRADGGLVTGSVFESSAVLRIDERHRHFWSPELQVGADAVDDDEPLLREPASEPAEQSLVSGIFGPRPAVWSLFIATYTCVAFIAIMGGSYGTSQLMLDQPATALWSLPGSLVAAALVYGVGRIGRQLGSSQMQILRDFLDDALSTCAEAVDYRKANQ